MPPEMLADEQEQQALLAALRAVLSNNDASATAEETALRAALEDQHPADVAQAMEQLSEADALSVFNTLDAPRAAEVLDEVNQELSRYLTDNALPGRIADLLDRLPMDDAAEVVSEASPERQEELLAELTARSPEDAQEVRELLSYGDDTAGRLMTDKFVRLSPDLTVDQAFALIRRADPDVETVNDLYVVDRGHGGEHLLGVLSIRELLRAHPDRPIRGIMETDVVTVTVDTDQQDVARLIGKYDFLAMPVLDRQGYLVGIVTVDDVIDVLVAEFNEDFMRLVGSDAEEMERRTPLQVARLRLPWLLGTMAIELVAGVVISRYDYVLREVTLLASFMPVISAISGNVGLQAAAIIVRGLETGHVSIANMGRAVRKEAATALLMAMACGLVLGTVGALWSHHLPFGLVIGGAMTASMLTAAMMGTVVPMLSKRLGFDPATTAGPFETAFQDVIGFGVFLWLASLMLPLLKH